MKIASICIALLVVTAIHSRAVAQTRPAGDPDEIVTLTYQVDDLLMRAPNYSLPDPRSGSNQPSVEFSQSSGLVIDALMTLLKDTVDQESWKENGGTVGTVRAIQGVLVITQSRQTHNRIAKLLTQLRSGEAMMMLSVRAYWVKLEPQEVSAIFAARKQRTDGSHLSEMPEVPDNLLDKTHLYYMGQTTCFSAQTVMITSLKEKTYISDLTPIVSNNAVAYDPTIGVAADGVKLQVTPKMLPGGDAVVVDLHSDVVQNTPGLEVKPAVASTRPVIDPSMNMMVQSREGSTQQMHTTVRIPLNRRVLIGGMTLEPGDNNTNPRQLYLAVEVNAMR
jgi:hypothetical protein